MMSRNFRQAAVVCALGLLSASTVAAQRVSLSASPFPGASPSPSPSFAIVESPNQSNQNYLKGVAPISSDDVWAVGYYVQNDLFLNLAMQWDGKAWTFFPTPNPGQPTYNSNQIKKVVAISTNDVWAVGGHQQSYILHWNGSTWSEIPRPPLAFNTLDDIAAVASNDIWIVGSIDSFNGGSLTLTLHWDGARWTRIPSPNVSTPGGNFYSEALDSVVALAANDVWAVGYYRIGSTPHTLILHWNGTQWSIVPSPDGPTGDGWLRGIAAAGPNDIWAVGEYDQVNWGSPGRALAMHWDGVSWTTSFVPPNPSPYRSSPLHSVVARGPNDFYAVGEWQTGSQGLNTQAVRWDGTAWNQIPSENPPGSGTGWNELHDIARDSSGGLWAVGKKQASFGSSNFTLVQRSIAPTAPLATTNVVSRKGHGSAGTFDIDLPLTGPIGIENRLATNGEYTLIYTFSTALTGVDNAAINAGTGIVGTRSIGPNQNQYTVQLTGVSDLQHLEVRLDGVRGLAGEVISSVVARMDVVVGDTNASRSVGTSDIGETKANVGAAITATTFRSDVTANGAINGSDVSAVKAKSGGGL